MLAKDPQYETAGDMINSGFEAMPLATKLPPSAFSKAHELAQKNAVEMLGLHPGNTAMDRARAMGFLIDKPLYHGTAADIEAYDLNHAGAVTNNPVARLGISLADEPAVAEEFARMSKERLYGQDGNRGETIYPVLHRIDKGASLPLSNDLGTLEVAGAIRDAWHSGYNGLRLSNYTTPDGKVNKQFYLLRDPSQVRFRFAAFDPAKKTALTYWQAYELVCD